MSNKPARSTYSPAKKPLVITRRYDEILQAVHCYRYVTAVDITRLFFAPTSLTHVREILSQLAGGKDYIERQYLFRFPLPDTRTGNTEKIYTLGAKGREHLQTEVGIDIDWYFRPSKVRHMSYGHLLHALTLTHFVVAAKYWCKGQKDVTLPVVRMQYELDKTPPYVDLVDTGKDRKPEEVRVKVVPDAWLDFYFPATNVWSPVLLEIDRGMEFQRRLKEHVHSRLAFIKKDGGYRQLFGTNAVIIAYVTTGGQARLTNMVKWTEEVLEEEHKTKWASVFRFCGLPTGELDPFLLFQASSWVRPFEKNLIPLL